MCLTTMNGKKEEGNDRRKEATVRVMIDISKDFKVLKHCSMKRRKVDLGAAMEKHKFAVETLALGAQGA